MAEPSTPATLEGDGAAPRAALRRAFLVEQIGLLEPFGYLVVASPATPPDVFEVARQEDGSLTVSLAARPLLAPYRDGQADGLRRRGLLGAPGEPPPRVAVGNAEEAAACVDDVLSEILGVGDPALLDVRHGTRRAEHEAAQRLDRMRTRIAPLLAQMLGRPAAVDSDGDYYFDFDTTQVYVAPRAAPGAPPIIRVFAITNIGVTITPELGLFLSRLNFGLAFGRFALDAEHQAVWFDETLLGEQVSDEELRFTIGIVAETATEWDGRIAEIFGGTTRQGAAAEALPEGPATKPGSGGYL